VNDPWQDPSPRKVLRRGGQGGVLGTGSASLHPNAPAVAAGAVAPIVPGFNSGIKVGSVGFGFSAFYPLPFGTLT